MQFDVVIDFAAPDRVALYRAILDEIQSLYPDWTLNIALDSDISD